MSQLAHIRPRSATGDRRRRLPFLSRPRSGDLLVVSALSSRSAGCSRRSPRSFRRPVGSPATHVLFADGAIAILVAAASSGSRRSRQATCSASSEADGEKWSPPPSLRVMVMIGIILLIIPGIIALSWTMVALPVAAIEGLAMGPAITRSRALARGRMGHVLGTMVLAWLIVLLLVVGSALCSASVGGVIGLPVASTPCSVRSCSRHSFR